MKKHIFSILVVLLLPFSVHAKTELVDKTTSGYGSTYQEALASALLDAVRQVKGLTVGSEKQVRADLTKVIEKDVTHINASIGVEEKIFTISKGWVDSYSIKSVSEPKGDDSRWVVTIVAKIPVHKSSIKDQGRQSIAVMPFRFAHTTFAINDMGQPSNAFQMSSRIRDRILSSLTQTQQFVVLNREHGSEFASEKALLSSDNVSPSEASRIGNVVGADLMVVGNIHDLSTKTETKSFYGATKTSTLDRVDLSYQVIEVATQKLLWADTLSAEFTRDEDQTTTSTLDGISRLVVSGVMDLIFPIKVLDVVSAEEVYLNQGKARIKEGDVFALFTQGRTMKDPDTGVEIKIDGNKTAELIAVNVQAKYTVTEVKDGNVEKVKKGDVVRMLLLEKDDIQKNKTVRETSGSSEAPIVW